jgi:membrane fusion protein, multidrug efflux system
MPKKIARPVLVFCLVLGFAFALWKLGELYGHSAESSATREGVPVRVALVRRDAIATSVSSIGTVQALNTVLVRARIDGAIEQVLFKEGQIVTQGEVLVKLDARPFDAQLRAAQAQRAKDAALLENATTDLRRYEYLVQNDSASTQLRDTARSLVQQLTATVANDDAQVDMARLSLSYTTITAPIAGRVGARLIDAGNIVHASDTTGLVVITQLKPIAITFAVPQDRLAELRAAQLSGPVAVSVLSEQGGPATAEGQLILIDNQIDTTTGTIRCKAVFQNATDQFWPGQFVTLRIALKTLPDATIVPSAAVQNGSEGPYIYIVAAGNVAKMLPVTVVSVEGDQTILGRGVTAGENVVTEGQFRLEPDVVVRVEGGDSPPPQRP